MATERSETTTFEANADLSTHQFKFVKLVTGGKVDLQDSATANACPGILYNKPTAAGQAAEVAHGPIVKIKLGDTVTIGQMVGSDTSGLGVAYTANNAVYYAIANEAGLVNEVIECTWVGKTFIGA